MQSAARTGRDIKTAWMVGMNSAFPGLGDSAKARFTEVSTPAASPEKAEVEVITLYAPSFVGRYRTFALHDHPSRWTRGLREATL